MTEPERVALGRLGRAHGLRGELRYFAYNTSSTILADVGSAVLRAEDGRELSVTIRSVRGGGKFEILGFDELRDRTAAEPWVNAVVEVDEAAIPEIEEDDGFYAFQLEGMQAVDVEGNTLGTIESVVDFGAGDILVIRVGSREEMIPFAEPYVSAIDVDAGVVEVTLMDLDDG